MVIDCAVVNVKQLISKQFPVKEIRRRHNRRKTNVVVVPIRGGHWEAKGDGREKEKKQSKEGVFSRKDPLQRLVKRGVTEAVVWLVRGAVVWCGVMCFESSEIS